MQHHRASTRRPWRPRHQRDGQRARGERRDRAGGLGQGEQGQRVHRLGERGRALASTDEAVVFGVGRGGEGAPPPPPAIRTTREQGETRKQEQHHSHAPPAINTPSMATTFHRVLCSVSPNGSACVPVAYSLAEAQRHHHLGAHAEPHQLHRQPACERIQLAVGKAAVP